MGNEKNKENGSKAQKSHCTTGCECCNGSEHDHEFSGFLISATTLPVKNENLEQYIQTLVESDIDMIHVDIMDGKYVEHKTNITPKLVKKLRSKFSFNPFTMHVMAMLNLKCVKYYAKSRADIIYLHRDSFISIEEFLRAGAYLLKKGIIPGIAIKPDEDISKLEDEIFEVYGYALVMGVTPGKSGQTFISDALKNIKHFAEMGLRVDVDGGLNEKTSKNCIKNGAWALAYGSYLHNAYLQNNLAETIVNLRKLKQ